MKTFRLFGIVLLSTIMHAIFFACSSDPIVPEVTVEMGNEDYFAKNMDFDSAAGEKTFSFNSNVEWSVSVAPTMNGETWCTVTPNSGKDGNNTIRIKVQENTGYDDRNVVLTLTAGSTLTKTITVTQKQKDAILLTTNKFEVEPQGGKINLEVKANVDYEAIISESSKSWISLASKSRGLTTSNLTFNIAETEEYDKREGEITIKSGDLSETVHIYQTGQEILLLTKNEYPISNKGETIAVELKSNFAFNVQMPEVDWVVDESKSRGVSSHTIYYTILPNETYDSREAEIIFYDKNSSIKDTLKIIQAQKDAIILSKKNYEVESNGGIIEVEINSNVDFEITIDSIWVKQKEQTNSRGLVNHKLYFQIEENQNYDIRYAHIVISDKNKSLTDTITIFQAQRDVIIINQKTLNISAVGEDTLINIASNIDYNLIIPNEYSSWIKQQTKSRGLNLDSHFFSILKNGEHHAQQRNGYILVESKLGKDTIFINQNAPISIDKAGTLKDLININNITSITSLLITGEINGTDILVIRKMTSLKYLDLSESKIVEGGSSYYEGNLTSNDVIGNSMFYNMDSLEKVSLPKSCIKIGHKAFNYCWNLLEVEMGDNIISIGDDAFMGARLPNIVFPNNLKSLGNQTFKGCEFEIITIPESLTNLGHMAFNFCDKLKEIHFKSKTPPTGMPLFWGYVTEEPYQRIHIYVPKGSYESYFYSEFGVFPNIIEE